MKKIGLLLIVLCVSSLAFGQDTLRGTYTYTYGDNESLVEARKTCKDLAIREAIESYYIYIQSATLVENYQLTEDVVRTISGAYLSNVQIIEQTEEGRSITITIEAIADPQQIKEVVDRLVREKTGTSETPQEQVLQGTPAEPVVQESQVLRRAVEFERRIQKVESQWQEGKPVRALAELRDLNALLNQVVPDVKQPFAYNLHRVITQYGKLLQGYLDYERTDRTVRRRDNRTHGQNIIRLAAELRESIAPLETMTGLTPDQQTLQQNWISRSRKLLERVRQEFPRVIVR